MKILIPIILILLAVAGGGAAGFFLKPAPEAPAEGADAHAEDAGAGEEETAEAGGAEEVQARTYVQIGRQFIIPIVEGRETQALMLFELAVDVPIGYGDVVFDQELRLRSAFNDVLFSMSHTGAFSENYTDDLIIAELKSKLGAAVERYVDTPTYEILILDMLRQEI